jgi:hypothetical protein
MHHLNPAAIPLPLSILPTKFLPPGLAVAIPHRHHRTHLPQVRALEPPSSPMPPSHMGIPLPLRHRLQVPVRMLIPISPNPKVTPPPLPLPDTDL